MAIRRRLWKKKVTLCTIIKLAWEKYHAIPIITWGLESPYVPHSYKNILGRTYHSGRKLEYAFPSVHNDIISEILNNTYIADNKPQYDSEGYWIPNNSTRCGVGRYNSSDSEGYPSPYEWFNAKCQEVADLINSLVAQDGTHIPVIFRLWHECEAKHFWWGGGNKQKYKDFYIYTVEKFRQLCPYKNILFGYCRDKYWSTEQSYLDRYPGDDYVDVMGFDNYSIGLSDSDTAKAILQMQIITKLARKHNKIPVLFETGNKQDVLKTKYLLSDVLYKCLKSKGVGLSICQIWSTFEIKNQINIDDYISF